MHWKVNMKKIIFLRGVTPTGTNRIPKMSYLCRNPNRSWFFKCSNIYSEWEYTVRIRVI